MATTASIVAFGMLAATTTGMSAVPIDQSIVGHAQRTAGFGSVGLSASADESTAADQLSKLREASGLTWEQLARLFGVSRRSVHHWASGDNMNAHHQELLAKVTAIVTAIPGPPQSKRAELLRAREDGTLFDSIRSSLAGSEPAVNGIPVSVAALLGAVARR